MTAPADAGGRSPGRRARGAEHSDGHDADRAAQGARVQEEPSVAYLEASRSITNTRVAFGGIVGGEPFAP